MKLCDFCKTEKNVITFDAVLSLRIGSAIKLDLCHKCGDSLHKRILAVIEEGKKREQSVAGAVLNQPPREAGS